MDIVVVLQTEVDNVSKSHPPPFFERLNFVSFFILIFVFNIVVDLVEDTFNHSGKLPKLLETDILGQQRYLLRFVELNLNPFIKFTEIPPDQLQAEVSFNSLLVQLGLLAFCGDKIEQLLPDLVFEEDFCAFHLET